jgi:phage anti-repressor protein
MNQKFSKKELERLGCNEEEVKLVMEYQKKLPVIIDGNDTVKYCVNIKELHTQLGVKDVFSRWIKNNLLCNFIQGEEFEICFVSAENKALAFKDYCDYSMQKLNYYNITKLYMITMNCAKEIAMIAGIASNANSELKENSSLARKYFILIERKIKENKQWLEIRDPEKEEYKNMSFEVEQWMLRVWHKKASKSVYSVEADGINKIVTGLTSQELKLKYNCPTNELIRDYLKKDYNEELLFLERQNQVLLRMNMGYTNRMNMLNKMHNVTFKENKVRQTA